MLNRRITLLCLLTLAYPMSACADRMPSDVAPNVKVLQEAGFKEDLFVARAGDFYVAGQPDAEDLVQFKRLGVTTVINLRGVDEMAWDEAADVRQLGLTYFQVPITSEQGLKPTALALVDELVDLSETEKILLHCRSGNRAAAWWAQYLIERQDIQAEQAFRLAQQAGLQQPMADKIKTLLQAGSK